jgi:hypothetical protein
LNTLHEEDGVSTKANDERFHPDSPFMTGAAFVEVRDEPLHRRRFENQFVRVFDVLVPPGERSLYHRHTEDTVYVVVGAANTVQWIDGKEVTNSPVEAGHNFCGQHHSKPLIHQVGNLGPSTMRLIGTEIRQAPPHAALPALTDPALTLRRETPRVRSYLATLNPGQALSFGERDYYGTLVVIDEGCLDFGGSTGWRSVLANVGDLLWNEGPAPERVVNIGETPMRCLLVELRANEGAS